MSTRRRCPLLLFLAVCFACSLLTVTRAADDDSSANDKKTIVFVAGRQSHGYGAHEHNAGCRLLAAELDRHAPQVTTRVFLNGWPDQADAFDDADAIVMYCDGGEGHMVIPHLDEVDAMVNHGVGIACLHYAVEIPKGASGDHLLDWIGGYFETYWSVNPHWLAKFTELPDHPVTRGVKPFEIDDEWYYHMRFRDNMEGVTPILTAIPPASTLSRPDGPHSGNPFVRAEAGQPQIVAWVSERANGARGFGFTGGHHHWNWGNDNFRRLALNAFLWIAHAEVPKDGIPLGKVTRKELEANQDEPKPEK